MRADLFENVRHQTESSDLSEFLHIFIRSGLTFAEQNRKLLLAVQNSSVASAMLFTITNDAFDQNHFPELFKDELEAQFLIGALNQCVRWWMNNMNQISKEVMQERIYELVDKYVEAVRQ